MNKKILIVLPLVGAFVFSGCATLLGGGGKQTVSINSEKPMKGTMAYTDNTGVQHFTTPATLNVERSSKDITLTSTNNEFDSTTVKSSMNGWFLGNILTGGPIGSTTDAVTGAMWKYDETVNISAK